ncbi:hypothetical protein SAMN05216298_0187 [Glycomyces sambucus]|uniref:Uncharacterized protein n=1 Tax=Glycomyces sambucus TaxID=380244 RepID=A0A1G9NBY9_9ACTN|nr:hypothetical protein [Glycomyces sambucus]SDL83415.1 hypothetical protein SAMN05216298_0187 [Glycomyces sambucus]
MTTLREFAPYIGIALFVIAIGAVFVRFKFADSVPRSVPVAVFAAASLAFLLTGAGLRLHEQHVLNRPLTVGDIVRPALEGELPTDATVESFQARLDSLGLAWSSGDTLLVDRPSDLLIFDDEFSGYIEGRAERDEVRLTAAIGFEGTAISWFTCHTSGTGDPDFVVFYFQMCLSAAEIDIPAVSADWVDSAVRSPGTVIGGFDVELARSCPVALSVVSVDGTPGWIESQLTISKGQVC